MIGPEELVVTKILAGRSKDLDDVQGILIAQEGVLDLGRVRELIGLLEWALDQADLLPASRNRSGSLVGGADAADHLLHGARQR